MRIHRLASCCSCVYLSRLPVGEPTKLIHDRAGGIYTALAIAVNRQVTQMKKLGFHTIAKYGYNVHVMGKGMRRPRTERKHKPAKG